MSDSPAWLHEDSDISATNMGGATTAPSAAPTINTGQSNTVVAPTDPAAADTKPAGPTTPWWHNEWRLFIITAIILVAMNFSWTRWLMYPFVLMSTWIHEMCHGIAALLVGGRIIKLEVFVDGSGLATYRSAASGAARGFISSAGYQGTCVTGYLLLILRKQRHIPRIGPIVLGSLMVISVLLFVRNFFGIVVVSVEGGLLIAAGLTLRKNWAKNLFLVLAILLTLTAITSVTVLFRASHEVNGAPIDSDAVSTAEEWFGFSFLWAMIWLGVGVVLAALGVRFPIKGPDTVAEPYLRIPGCARFGGEDVATPSASEYVAGNSNVNAARSANNMAV